MPRRYRLRHLIAHAWLRAVSLCAPRLVPLPALLRHRCRCRCRLMASRSPPRLIDTPDGAIRRPRGGSRLLLARHRFAISSVRFGIGWRRGFGACLVILPRLPLPYGHHRCRLLTVRSLNPISSSSCRPIASSPRSLDTGNGEMPLGLGCLSLRFYFACCLFVLVLCIAVAGVALLA